MTELILYKCAAVALLCIAVGLVGWNFGKFRKETAPPPPAMSPEAAKALLDDARKVGALTMQALLDRHGRGAHVVGGAAIGMIKGIASVIWSAREESIAHGFASAWDTFSYRRALAEKFAAMASAAAREEFRRK
jgi:hypothetical protein